MLPHKLAAQLITEKRQGATVVLCTTMRIPVGVLPLHLGLLHLSFSQSAGMTLRDVHFLMFSGKAPSYGLGTS